VEAMPTFILDKNVKTFEKHGVLSKSEIHSRYEILVENYSKTIHIEALTLIDLVKKNIVPAVLATEGELVTLLKRKKQVGEYSVALEENLLKKLSGLADQLVKRLEELEEVAVNVPAEDSLTVAKYYRETVFSKTLELRMAVDELETAVGSKNWTLPTYAELLYSVL
jgi:glutamine synthetase